MNNGKLIRIVAEREFRQSIHQKGFWIFTFLFPLLMGTAAIIPIFFSGGASERIQVHVMSAEATFSNLPLEGSFTWIQENGTLVDALNALASKDEKIIAYYENHQWQVMSNQALSPARRGLLERYLHTLSTKHNHSPNRVTYQLPEYTAPSVNQWALIPGVLFIMVMTYYGNKLVKGFLEEKQNRIAEVILSHLPPGAWLAGKTLGVAYLAITQLVLWAGVIGGLGYLLYHRYGKAMALFNGENAYQLMLLTDRPNLVLEWNSIAEWLTHRPDLYLLALGALAYPVFFASYSALLGAIASRGQQESDSQPWLLAVNLPLILFTGIAPILYASSSELGHFFWAVFPLSSPICLPYYILESNLLSAIFSTLLSITLHLLLLPILAKHFRIGILRF